jgi:hypothetical protein
MKAKESMSLIADSKTISKTGIFSVTVVINSRQPVTGYDSKILFDSKKLKFLEAKTLNTNFDIYTQNKDGEIIISGIKSLTVNTPILLNNISVARVDFQPLMNGIADLQLVYTPGSKAETNIISDKSQDIIEDAHGVSVSIGDTLTLSQNQTVNLDSLTTLTVRELGIPGKECADCMTTMVMEVKREGKVEKAEFRVGGIAGFMDRDATALGYSFHLQDILGSTAVVVYTKL